MYCRIDRIHRVCVPAHAGRIPCHIFEEITEKSKISYGSDLISGAPPHPLASSLPQVCF